ncbi:transposable element Tcb2 transposase [Trichonephila clavipes]|nr:transposable element Tcb2 transposase [Trichonephila clavipes]
MSERSNLHDLLRWRVVGWMEMELSHSDPARRLNVSRNVVHRLWNQYQTEASLSTKHVPERPRATSPAGDRFITLSVRRRRTISAPQLVADHSVASGRRRSASMVHRCIHNSGLYARRWVVCVSLNRGQRRAHLSWEADVSWTRQQSASVLFTYESRFTLESIFDVKDSPHTGRPDVENVDKITEIIEVDRHNSNRSIAQELKIDHKTVLNHLRKFGFKKKLHVCGSHQLTPKNMMD